MDTEIRLAVPDQRITEALFTWNCQNNTESVGYEMKKIKLQYLRQLVCVRYCDIFTRK